MKVRIVNNGQHANMTQITEAETGRHLDLQLTEVTIKVGDDLPYAILTSIEPVIDIIADAEIKQVCPCCGKPVDVPLQGSEQAE